MDTLADLNTSEAQLRREKNNRKTRECANTGGHAEVPNQGTAIPPDRHQHLWTDAVDEEEQTAGPE